MKRMCSWVAVLLTLAVLASDAAAEPCTSGTSECRYDFQVSSGKSFPIYGSFPLEYNEAVDRVVIVVHGSERNADDYFERLVAATSVEGQMDSTLLLAPFFKTADDSPSAAEHYWSSGGWKVGNKSLDDPGRFSSFDAMNELVDGVCSMGIFPRLQTVVIVGHSAGGQFVNRYAAGGAGCPNPAIDLRFIVMNPSSYLYASNLRWLDGAFRVPTTCSGYDEYKYGFDDLNSYMARVGVSRLQQNLFTRTTFYLAGEEDTAVSDSLDTSCSGNLQGAHRLERQQNYLQFRELFEGWSSSIFRTVPGVGHSSSKMLLSEAAREYMFRASPLDKREILLPPTLLRVTVQ